MDICRVEIKPINRDGLFEKLEEVLLGGISRFHHGVTVNPEYIVEAQKNDEFRDVLNRADFTLVDGVGLMGAMHYQLRAQIVDRRTQIGKYVQFFVSCVDAGFLKQPVLIDGVATERITGVGFVQELVKKDWMKGKKVFLLGGKTGVAEKAARELKRLNTTVEFGWSSGHRDIRSQFVTPSKDGVQLSSNNQDPSTNNQIMTNDQSSINQNWQIVDRINAFKPDVLFVAYGHPWQDLWIDRVKAQLPSVRLAMGVGGTFDYLAGEVGRAPQWMQDVGLEWLYRVCSQPQRLERVVNATWRFGRLVVGR